MHSAHATRPHMTPMRAPRCGSISGGSADGHPQGKKFVRFRPATSDAINAVNGPDLQNPQAGAIRQLIKPLLELCLTPGSVANTASVTFYFWTQPHSQPRGTRFIDHRRPILHRDGTEERECEAAQDADHIGREDSASGAVEWSPPPSSRATGKHINSSSTS